MAEPAGLALGSLALISLFTDCVDIFKLISASRSLGRDYELVNTKLNIEKTLLLQWSTRVRLFDPNYDHRLDHPQIRPIVEKTLASILLLLQESHDLKWRYGLEQEDPSSTANSVMTSQSANTFLGSSRMARFVREFAAFQTRIRVTQENSSHVTRIRWVVIDKDKFNCLLTELSYFITRLHRILPPDQNAMMSMAREDVRGLSSRQLELVWKIAGGGREDIAEDITGDIADQAKRAIAEGRVLQTIWFRAIDERRDSVRPAHSQTFGWVFTPSCADLPWDCLPQWLQSSNDIYWLAGKAGCGKSTLMKYLWNDSRTRELLTKWAGENAELVMGSFFFYNLGRLEQHSYEGLWRALLFQVINARPNLIPELLPNMWREVYGSDKKLPDLPSYGEIEYAFDKLVEIQDPSTKYCFFIDGLDEFSGKLDEAIAFLDRLATSPRIKLLVSSRPVPFCVDFFSVKPQLMLQDLTRPDIKLYVEDRVHSHPYARLILQEDECKATIILNDLVEKSSGVFLWVVLACNSVLEGFAAFDHISELERRINELPPELKKLFRHMLQSIDARYQQEALMFLLLCHTNDVNQYTGPLPCLGLALVEITKPNMMQAKHIRHIPPSLKLEKCRILEGRLRSRSCGLLEIVPPNDGNISICFCDYRWSKHDQLVDATVCFIHRSVSEFLQTSEFQDLLHCKLKPGIFFPNMLLALIYAQIFELSRYGRLEDNCIHAALLFADQCLDAPQDQMNAILNIVESSFVSRIDSQEVIQSSVLMNVAKVRDSECFTWHPSITLLLVVERGLLNVVRTLQTAATSDGNLSSFKSPQLLAHAIYAPCWRGFTIPKSMESVTEMMCYLLASGCNAKGRVMRAEETITPWKLWADWCAYKQPNFHFGIHEVTKCFIEVGCDVQLREISSSYPAAFEEWVSNELLKPHSKKSDQMLGERLLRFIAEQNIKQM